MPLSLRHRQLLHQIVELAHRLLAVRLDKQHLELDALADAIKRPARRGRLIMGEVAEVAEVTVWTCLILCEIPARSAFAEVVVARSARRLSATCTVEGGAHDFLGKYLFSW